MYTVCCRMMRHNIVCVGEGMAEVIVPAHTEPFSVPWTSQPGGDTLNTAIYLSRVASNINIAYLSVLGTDPVSCEMRQTIAAEGINTGMISEHPTRKCALCMVHTDGAGERTFTYYGREVSAARSLLDGVVSKRTIALDRASVLYFSGITLAVMSPAGRDTLLAAARTVRERGGEVVFDTNHRPVLWGTHEEAQACYARLASLITIALPSLDDEQLMYGPEVTVNSIVQRYLQAGAREVVVKCGKEACYVAAADFTGSVPNPFAIDTPVDTSAAGDSFNAGYLAARLGLCEEAEMSPVEAALVGHRVASLVVQQRGSVMPRSTWETLWQSQSRPESDVFARVGAMLEGVRVVPVLVLDTPEQAVAVAKALIQGGLRVLEVTLRTPRAAECISAILLHVPNAIVGAGTVTDADQMAMVARLGAHFAVSPGSSAQLIAAARTCNMPFIPGVATPSEALAMSALGVKVCKFFPAELAGGVKYLKAMGSVYPDLKFFPTGGITANSLQSYLDQSNVICVGGTWLVPKGEDADLSKITENARFVLLIK